MSLALLAAIISVISLDTTIAFQVLISSPIFACPLLGWLMGDLQTGFELGVLFQLIWLGRIPAGATSVPEGNLATMWATALVILLKELNFPHTTLTMVVLLAIGFSYLGAKVTIAYRKMNGYFLDWSLKQLEQMKRPHLGLVELTSILFYLVIIFMVTWITLYAALQLLYQVVPAIGATFETKLVVIRPVLFGIGLATVMPMLWSAFKERK
ncbi:MAG: hypothetical protein Kow0037_10670 [Calditrichia bacterium]